ncbi:aminoacyl-tRNA deacylase [Ligilactobacillus ceti]|uniref:Cys-tRNA(Pro)/Cys-tRNA(Cys) deacylase n=1 Tax=Ligilactobacillus ceti DSM 22408 TaxID=1122146 RepID=A0A0R2KRB2_9LACO|nr:aminoacyl-tRNA deacylase [Ligilactobacillus ceti]KRN89066.1 transcriptional regulator [Ligilactobacillus ceti DSM 22408]
MAKKKKNKIKKTNEERILDQHNIPYEEYSFEFLKRGASAFAEAEEQGIEPNSILKTIVLNANKDPKDYLVVCLSLLHEIDLKLIARQLGKKQVHLADNKNLINITGYVHGENTPIGISFKTDFPIYFDERIQDFTEVSVSAGKIGRSVRLNREALVELVKGEYIQVAK